MSNIQPQKRANTGKNFLFQLYALLMTVVNKCNYFPVANKIDTKLLINIKFLVKYVISDNHLEFGNKETNKFWFQKQSRLPNINQSCGSASVTMTIDHDIHLYYQKISKQRLIEML